MKLTFILLAFIICTNEASAQSDKKVVAIMPFLSSQPANRNNAAQLQSIALQTFMSKSNVKFIDRSTDPMVIKELDNQIREQSISSKVLVEQGKLSGSTELIIGTLVSISVESKRVGGIIGGSETKYIADVSFSLQVVDAATGLMISSKDFNGNTHSQDLGKKIFGNTNVLGKASNMLMADTKDEAIRKSINATKAQIEDWVNEVYPPEMKLINIESRDKKGFPEVVLIAGFPADVSVGKTITIKEITLLDDGSGGKLKREKKIGELKVTEVQGQITVCKVKNGEDVLEEKMKRPETLKFIIE